MDNLTMTNVWLGILAVVSLLEFLIIVVAGLMGYKLYRQATESLATVERLHIAPLRARVDAVLDEVQLITGRVKHAQNSVGDAVKQVAGAGGHIADTVRAKAWPILGVISGLRSVVSTLISEKNDGPDRPDRPTGPSGPVRAAGTVRDDRSARVERADTSGLDRDPIESVPGRGDRSVPQGTRYGT